MTEALVGGGVRRAKPSEAETLSFWTLNGSRKCACFLVYGDAKNHRYLQSHDPRSFSQTFQT